MTLAALTLLTAITTPAQADPVDLTLSGGATTVMGNAAAFAELDVRPLSALSFATTVGSDASYVSVHEAIRLHPLKSRTFDPYLGATLGIWPGMYDDGPLFLTPGLQLGLQSQIGEHLVIGGDVEADMWTNPASDLPLVALARLRVGWKF